MNLGKFIEKMTNKPMEDGAVPKLGLKITDGYQQ
jgi:hypothetical protein